MGVTAPEGRRPFRFACRISGRSRTATELGELARRAELLGYSTFAVADHFATRYAPLLVLQFVAACTSKIRLATLVLDNDFRHGNRSQIVERWARHHGVAAADLDRSAHVLAGSVDQVVEHLQRLREATGITYVTIRSDEIEDFAPVVEILARRK